MWAAKKLTTCMIIRYYSINPLLRRDSTLIVDVTPSYLLVEQITANSITLILLLVFTLKVKFSKP